jgi:putative transposase
MPTQDYSLYAIQLRLYPTKQQAIFLEKSFGCNRYIWNASLNACKKDYAEHGKKANNYKTINSTLKIEKINNEWLKEVDAWALQQTTKHLFDTYKNFFSKKCGFPKFKKKTETNSFTSGNGQVKIINRTLKIPKLKIPIKWRQSKNIIPENYISIQTATIKKTKAGNYYASILFRIPKKPIKQVSINSKKIIGADFGLKNFITTSNGDKIKSPEYFKKSQKKLAKLQKRHSKKKANSKNREKARLKLAKQYEHITNQRKDFLHKLSTSFVNDYNIICVEDLNLEAMKKLWGRKISDYGYATFVNMLQYKSAKYGKLFVKIDRFEKSTGVCPECGHILKNKLNLSIREWQCPKCSKIHDRDIAAAQIIAIKGRKHLKNTAGTVEIKACGDKSSDGVLDLGQAIRLSLSKKQENQLFVS